MPAPTRILITTGDCAKGAAVARVLGGAGYTVAAAGTGAEAVRRISEFRPAVVLLDGELPDESGIRTLREIHSNGAIAGVAVTMLLSRAAASEDVAGSLDAGADDVISWPADEGEFLARVRVQVRRQEETAQLRASEARYRAIVETEPECVKTVSPAGHLLDMNPAGLRMIEAEDGKEVFGHAVIDLIHAEDRALFQEAHKRACRGETVESEFRIRGIRGTHRWMESRSTPLRGEDGTVHCVLSVTRDVTERRRTEAALRESEQKYRDLVETSDDLIWAVDAEGRITFVNQACRRIYGREPEEMLGRPFLEFVPPEQYEKDLATFMEGLRSGEGAMGYTSRVCRKDGSVAVLSANAQILRDEKGRVTGAAGISRDLTALQSAEEALRASEASLARAQGIAHLGSWELTIATGELRWSAEVFRIFDVAPSDFGGTFEDFLNAVHPEDRDAMREEQRRALSGEGGPHFEHRIVRPDGSVRWVLEAGALERDGAGWPVRLTGTVLDITERKKGEQERDRMFNLSLDLLSVGSYDGVLEQVNPAWTKSLGWSTEELTNRPWMDFVHPEDRAATERAGATLTRGEPLRDFENRYRCKDGSFRWLSWNSHPLPETRQIFGVARDITERKRAEEKLSESEALRRIAGQSARLGGWAIELPAQRLTWSDEVRQIHEVAPDYTPTLEEAVEFYPPEYREEVGRHVAACSQNGTPFHFELELITATKRRIHVRAIGEAVHDQAGRVCRIQGAFQDITAEKRSEGELRRTTGLLQAVVNGTTDVVFAKDLSGHYLLGNEATARAFQQPLEDILGRNDRELFPPDEARRIIELDREVMESGEVRNAEDVLTLAGRRRVFQSVKAPYRDGEGNVIGLIGISRDVTEQREREEEIRQSEARLQHAQRIAKLGNWEWDILTGEIRWSPQVFDFFGVLPSAFAVTYDDFLQTVHPEDRERVQQAIADAVAGEVPYDLDHRTLWPDGTVRTMHGQGEVERDADGRAVRMTGTVQDITEREQRDDAMRQKDALIRIAGRMTHTGGWAIGVPGNEVFWSDEIFEILEFPAGQPPPLEEALALYPAKWQSKVVSTMEEAAQNGTPFDIEVEIDTSKGRRRWVRVAGEGMRDGAGVIRWIQGAFQDITEQKLAEQERERLAHRLETTLESLTDAFFTLDPQWRVTYLNSEAEQLMQRGRDELMGRNIWELYPDAMESNFYREYSRAVTEQVSVHFEEFYGPWEKWLDVRVYPSSEGLAVYFQDITEQKRNRDLLAERNRALELLSRCNEALIRSESETDLLTAICEGAVAIGGYRMAWAGYARDADKRVEPRACAGIEDGYLSNIRISWDEEEPDGQGPAGRVVRSGQTVVVPDFEAEASFQRWIEAARARGYRGVVCLPLKENAHTFGVLTLYLAEVRNPQAEELRLLEDLARNLSFGILNLRARATQQRTHDAVLALARGGPTSTGHEFFVQLTFSMVEALGAYAGFLARLTEDGTSATTLCAVTGGELAPNFRYDLAGTPCENLQQCDTWVVPREVLSRYQQSQSLREMGIESYAGVKLLDPAGRAIGLFVLYQEPMAQQEFVVSTLKIYGSRVAAEFERQKAEMQLREQASLLDKAQDAILVRDLDHRITYWNQSAERLYGWTAAEAKGRPVRELLYPETASFDDAWRELLLRGEWVGELDQIDRAGRRLNVSARWTLVRDDAGVPRSVLAINTDITDRKKLEQQFLRSQRMESLGTLAGGIAHDLNNLLLPITLGVDILRRYETDLRSRRVVDHIERSALRGADLVKQILSFARGLEGSRVPIQVGLVLTEAATFIERTFPKNITLICQVPNEVGLVAADPTQMNQVVLNLCVNARDAMPEGGRLTLAARDVEIDEQYALLERGVAAGRYVVIEVTDTGCGMSRETADRIFEPFFTTKELGKGTGLGLSTVRGIVKSHGGFVNVYSEIGGGSTFKVYLPTRPDFVTDEADREPEGPLPRGDGEVILVVDDEVTVLDITKQTLQAFGYSVLTASDGADAIGVYATRGKEIALILTDMMMPVMDGVALINAIRRINPKARIIAASGLNANGNVAKAANAGVNHFLPKPYSADAMLHLIRRVLTVDCPEREDF